jgi:hypothetical protein
VDDFVDTSASQRLATDLLHFFSKAFAARFLGSGLRLAGAPNSSQQFVSRFKLAALHLR